MKFMSGVASLNEAGRVSYAPKGSSSEASRNRPPECAASWLGFNRRQMRMIAGLLLKYEFKAHIIMPDSERAKDFQTVAVCDVDQLGMVF